MRTDRVDSVKIARGLSLRNRIGAGTKVRETVSPIGGGAGHGIDQTADVVDPGQLHTDVRDCRVNSIDHAIVIGVQVDGARKRRWLKFAEEESARRGTRSRGGKADSEDIL